MDILNSWDFGQISRWDLLGLALIPHARASSLLPGLVQIRRENRNKMDFKSTYDTYIFTYVYIYIYTYIYIYH